MTLHFRTFIPLFFALACTAAHAGNTPALEKPTSEQAKSAMVKLMGDLLKDSKIRLGTCVPAAKATQKGLVACTVLVTLGAGSSETQADFYKDPKQSGRWVAQPSESQDLLPFPDPNLQ